MGQQSGSWPAAGAGTLPHHLMDAVELSIYLSLHSHRASAACVWGRLGSFKGRAMGLNTKGWKLPPAPASSVQGPQAGCHQWSSSTQLQTCNEKLDRAERWEAGCNGLVCSPIWTRQLVCPLQWPFCYGMHTSFGGRRGHRGTCLPHSHRLSAAQIYSHSLLFSREPSSEQRSATLCLFAAAEAHDCAHAYTHTHTLLLLI